MGSWRYSSGWTANQFFLAQLSTPLSKKDRQKLFKLNAQNIEYSHFRIDFFLLVLAGPSVSIKFSK
jgi:hypothetical protein